MELLDVLDQDGNKTGITIRDFVSMRQFLEQTIREAGSLVIERYGESSISYTKRNETDIVTTADLFVNDFIIKKIQSEYPDHGIISEESPEYQKDAEYRWIVDPLDGTVNFFRGTPLFGIAIAVARGTDIILSAIFDPVHSVLIVAAKGNGAWENGRQIRCSSAPSLTNTLGCYPSKFSRKSLDMFGKCVSALYDRNVWFTAFSSACISAMQVASGKRDWYISLSSRVWDLAAAALILREAGCVVTTLEGKPWELNDEGMLAANQQVHAELLSILKQDV